MANKTPESPVNEAAVKADLKTLSAQIDYLMPHLNKANSAFGGLDEHVANLQQLKDQVAKARSIYGV